MALKVKRFLTSVNASNCYLCWCGDTGEGVIVDPSEFGPEIQKAVSGNGVTLTGIFITHGHYDHDSAVGDVRAAHEVPVFAAGNYPGGRQVSDGDTVAVGAERFRVVSTPGHTEDSISFIGTGLAFVGDALFAAAVGGTSSRAYFEREVQGVREHILSLPDCYTLYPGHGPATTVAVERSYNPFFM
jgi:hydroxyacylglutathione hydrolase